MASLWVVQEGVKTFRAAFPEAGIPDPPRDLHCLCNREPWWERRFVLNDIDGWLRWKCSPAWQHMAWLRHLEEMSPRQGMSVRSRVASSLSQLPVPFTTGRPACKRRAVRFRACAPLTRPRRRLPAGVQALRQDWRKSCQRRRRPGPAVPPSAAAMPPGTRR